MGKKQNRIYLTDKEDSFVTAYVETRSPSKAYDMSKYSKNLSPHARTIQADKLLKKGHIAVAVKERIVAIEKATEDTTIATVMERKQIATKGMRGELKDVEIIQYQDGTKVTKIKTSQRAPYITELNRMDGIGTRDIGDINILIGKIINNLQVNNISIESLPDEELKLLAFGGENEKQD